MVGRFFGGIASLFVSLGSLIGIPPRHTAVTPDGPTVEIPADADSSGKYITKDGSGLVERVEDGVVVVSRQAAE